MPALTGRLFADFSAGHFVHAYLFVGPSGTGKRSIADICARALNCTGDGKPCDVCPACTRALAGSHPDIVRLSKPGQILVDDVRGLIQQVSVRPFEGGMHAFIIERADQMTPQAQNALLKTLENPPDSAVFFLLAESAAPLLPTVLSRCRIMRFHEIDPESCARALMARGIEAERARLLAKLSAGSVGKALELNEREDYWPLRERVQRALECLKEPASVSAATAALIGDKEDAREVLDIMELIAREWMLAQEHAGERVRRERPIGGDRLLMAVMDARERLKSNVVWVNVLESLFMALMAFSDKTNGTLLEEHTWSQ